MTSDFYMPKAMKNLRHPKNCIRITTVNDVCPHASARVRVAQSITFPFHSWLCRLPPRLTVAHARPAAAHARSVIALRDGRS